MKILLIIYGFLFLITSSNAAEIYKCKINGRTVYTDKACDGERLKLKSINSSSSDSAFKKYNGTKWYYNIKGYQEALRLSGRYNAPLFIFFEADWCVYCRKLEKELLHKPQAKSALRPFITVQISPEDGKAENHLFKSLGGTGYPTIFIQQNKQSPPKKVRLQARENSQWRTQNINEFKKLLASYLVE